MGESGQRLDWMAESTGFCSCAISIQWSQVLANEPLPQFPSLENKILLFPQKSLKALDELR